MKLLLEIKGIFDEGRGYQKIKHEIEVDPVFKATKTKIDDLPLANDKSKDLLKKAVDSDHFKTSRKEQYDDYLSSHDSIIRDMMNDLGIYTIENWKVLRVGEKRKKKTSTEVQLTKSDKKKLKVESYIEQFVRDGNMDQEVKDEFEAVYTKMHPEIKHLSVIDQIKVTMAATGVGFATASQAYQNIIDTYKSFDDEKEKAELESLEKINNWLENKLNDED